ncbi:MAG TPA: hypothetical protein PKD48_02810 [Sphingopyxis sp.]|nr:hypothetical protein [Sphingopyxis sp.]HMQ17822.1 hypothetical protein [Sphingopyxis sp.]
MSWWRAGLALCSALSLAPTLGAQDAPTPRSYSLVSAQAVDSMQSDIRVDCPEGVVCIDNVSFAAFAHARTLSGPDVGERFGAAILTHLRLRDQPMLMLVEHRDGGERIVRAYARAPREGGRACLYRSLLDKFGSLPSGEAVEVDDLRVCALTPAVVPAEPPLVEVSRKMLGLSGPRRTPGKPRFRLTPRSGSGPVILALIETERGYPNGDWYCPPEPEGAEETICLGAAIVMHPGRVAHRYGGSDNVDPDWRASRFKAIGRHAVRWMEGGRWLAVIEQTDQDYYYVQWKVDARGNRFCLPQSVIDHYGIEAMPRFKLNRDGDRCYAVKLPDSW